MQATDLQERKGCELCELQEVNIRVNVGAGLPTPPPCLTISSHTKKRLERGFFPLVFIEN